MSNRLPAALLAAVLAVSVSVVVWSSPSRAQGSAAGRLVVLQASASPSLPVHSLPLGRLRASQEIHLDVTLKLPDPAAVTSFITSLSDRNSPNYRRFLAAGQFGPRFGASLSQVAAVEAVLRGDGLDPGPVTSNRLLIPVTAPVSAIDRAFHVSLVRYKLPGGRVVFTTLSPPRISASVSPEVEGVVGLNDLLEAHTSLLRSAPGRSPAPRTRRLVQPRSAGPVPCAAAIKASEQSGSHTSDVLAGFYGMTPLYALGDFGQGVHIAVVEFEPNLQGDILAYKACYKVHTTVNYIEVDGGPGSGTGSGEAALDIETIIGLAPKARIDVYQGAKSPTPSDVLDVYSSITSAETDQIISTGWGECEPDVVADDGAAFITSEQTLFEQAATQGQTVFAAAGDNGSTDCFGDAGTTNGAVQSVDDPGSQPYVISVGGTTIGPSAEKVWNDSSTKNGAGGGGASAVECMPSYQTQSSTAGKSNTKGLISADSISVPTKTCANGYRREVPDVSADADPASGYVFYWTSATASAAGWAGGTGGTSAATPLWAAVAALVDASPFCSDYGSADASPKGTLAHDASGLLFDSLYYIADSPYYPYALYDVTIGDNFYTPADGTDDVYPATKGFDMASGLGTPNVAYVGNFFPGLAALTCGLTATKLTATKIASVTPDIAPAQHATKVTITGSGFLPIKGADILLIGSKTAVVSCSSSTRCHATVPARKAGTEDLRMAVEDLTVSALTTSDRFTFAGVPTVTRVRPLKGTGEGRTTVTIHGTGFFGSVKVRFGPRRATHIHVVSSTKITAWAPSGAGTVYVYVTTLAGTSKKTPVGTYRYTPEK